MYGACVHALRRCMWGQFLDAVDLLLDRQGDGIDTVRALRPDHVVTCTVGGTKRLELQNSEVGSAIRPMSTTTNADHVEDRPFDEEARYRAGIQRRILTTKEKR